MATAKTPAKAGSKSKKPIGPKPGEYPGKIIDIDVSDEMSGSFLEYAYSVIYSRALPDARDGLSPFIEEFSTPCLRWAFDQSADM